MSEVNHNPDVLTCLANLSNDEVFTPPEVANAMLDLIPDDFWKDPNVRVLDPACKSGVFLREAARRFLKGEEEAIPDLKERIDHVFHKQLFGYAITELTSQLSRRTVYCSKTANGKYSVTSFKSEGGNIAFSRVEHRWIDGKCAYCGASQDVFDRGADAETHAYKFIHLTPQQIKDLDMKFDLIIGNPPYQLETDGAGRQAKPIYQYFVKQAKKLSPHFLVMITPSRWFSGGMGLDSFREEMLNDVHIKEIVDYSLSNDCFPGVDIAGGVSYFLRDSNYNGLCNYTYIDGNNKTSLKRKLNEFNILIRDNNAIEIVRKVQSFTKKSIVEIMSSLGPFGLGTAERGISQKQEDCYLLQSSVGKSYINKNKISSGFEYIDKWKVIIGKATSAGAATAGKDGLRKVIATLDILEPNAVCTFSYFIGGCFDSKKEAENCRGYLATKFVRFLLLQSLASINITKDRFMFVPLQDFSRSWNDEELYQQYNLTNDEILHIESMIKPME